MNGNDPQDEQNQDEQSAASLSADMKWLADHRHHPLRGPDGKVDPDRYLKFVQEYNEFISHRRRKFRPIIIRDARL